MHTKPRFDLRGDRPQDVQPRKDSMSATKGMLDIALLVDLAIQAKRKQKKQKKNDERKPADPAAQPGALIGSGGTQPTRPGAFKLNVHAKEFVPKAAQHAVSSQGDGSTSSQSGSHHDVPSAAAAAAVIVEGEPQVKHPSAHAATAITASAAGNPGVTLATKKIQLGVDGGFQQGLAATTLASPSMIQVMCGGAEATGLLSGGEDSPLLDVLTGPKSWPICVEEPPRRKTFAIHRLALGLLGVLTRPCRRLAALASAQHRRKH